MPELDKVAGFEIAKLSCSEEVAFRIRSRRNKLLGLWVASQLGLSEGDAEAYAREIVAAGVERSGEEALLRHIVQDCAARGNGPSEAAVREEMDRLTKLAAMEHGAAPDTSPRQAA